MDTVFEGMLDGMLAKYVELRSLYNPNASPQELDALHKALLQHNAAFKKQVEVVTMMGKGVEERWVLAIEECNQACRVIADILESIPMISPVTVMKQVFEKHNKLIRCIDKIQDTYGENFKDFGIDLPRIVVVGEENVGKSSVLENIAGVAIFPRAEGICTRLPFQMRMHHRSPERMIKDYGSKVPDAQNAVIVSFADKPNVFLSDPNEMRQRITEITEEKTKGVGVRNEVVVMNVYSTRVADLTIIDLPGIISAYRPNEPANIHDVTLGIVRQYIRNSDDTIVLAVLPANLPISSSQALREVQLAKAESRTIAVITKVDLANVRDKVEQKILGTSADSVALPNGYIGVVNRDTEDPQTVTEEDYFKQHFPNLWQNEKVGCFALTKQLNMLLDKHIRTKWAPKTKSFILSKQTEVKRLLDGLGMPVPSSDRKNFFQTQISEFCSVFTKDVDSHLTHMHLLISQKAIELNKRGKVEIVTGMVDYARQYLRDTLLKSSLDNCKLSRFLELCNTIRKLYDQQSKAPREKCHTIVLQIAEVDSFSLPSGATQFCYAEQSPVTCPVCREPIGKSDKADLEGGGVATLQCSSSVSHPMHVRCFTNFIRNTPNPRCPTCRAQIPSKLEKAPRGYGDAPIDPLVLFTLKAIGKYLVGEIRSMFPAAIEMEVSNATEQYLLSALIEDEATAKLRETYLRQTEALRGALAEIQKYT